MNLDHFKVSSQLAVSLWYSDSAPDYEEDITNCLQHRKHVAVDDVDSLLGDNKDALILDLGAGTGIIGKILYDRGYKNLVALEPSQGMVNEAKKKDIYMEFITEMMTEKPTSIKAETFDVVIGSGVLAKTHINDTAFPEILRITKKGGYIIFLNLRTSGEELEGAMETLVAKGAWRMLNRKLVPDYVRSDEGILFSLQKTL